MTLRHNSASAVTIGVASATPAASGPTLCRAGSAAPSVAACTLNFADSGFIFDVPDTFSNQPQTLAIKAVKKSEATRQCVPGFANQTKRIKFWSGYISPVSLPFDAQGRATITVNYPDAGQVQLSARYEGTGSETGLVMLGADQFVARPVGLCITPPQGVCAAGDSSCPVFKKAGETFQVDIKAMAWESANDGDICAGNQTTPNFALPNIALGTTLVAPNTGTHAVLGTTSYHHGAAANSLNSVNQTLSEVGVFRMTATPPTNGYFGYTIPAAGSQPIGRFVPWEFVLQDGFLTQACHSFSYVGQPVAAGFTLQARNRQGGVTANYQGAFARGQAALVAVNDRDGVNVADEVLFPESLGWQQGEIIVNPAASEKNLALRRPDQRTLLIIDAWHAGGRWRDAQSPSWRCRYDASVACSGGGRWRDAISHCRGARGRAHDGELVLQFGAPHQPWQAPYRVDLSQQPDQPLWLSDPDTLRGMAIFDSARGNARLIYRREGF
ncbi:DUF6701 domain-containing protein [Aeromonas sp. 164P]